MLVLSMVNAANNGILDGTMTCGDLLKCIHQLSDTTVRADILQKELGNGTPGRNFRIACVVFCIIIFCYVVFVVLHAARNGNDPDGDLAQVHSVYDAVSELLKALFEAN